MTDRRTLGDDAQQALSRAESEERQRYLLALMEERKKVEERLAELDHLIAECAENAGS